MKRCNGRRGVLGVLLLSAVSGHAAQLNGVVDSSLVNRDGINSVYIFSGTVTPDDVDGVAPEPVATVLVAQDAGACTWRYVAGELTDGEYTIAFTSEAGLDDPDSDEPIAFDGTTSLTLSGAATHDFPAANVLRVGPTRLYTRISDVAPVAQDGDVIEVDAGEYIADVAVWSQNDLTLRGVGGRPHLRAAGVSAQGKGIWVTDGARISVENFEFSEAAVTDNNGAGIRIQGPDIRICGSYFHDNENGVLGGAGTVLIEHSEFEHNGLGELGQTHNVYISSVDPIDKLVFRYNYSHHATFGHNLKTRARENHILFNRLMDEAEGNSSLLIDVPNGGLTFVIGNLLHQSPLTENFTLLAYGIEGLVNPDNRLYVVNNTFVNDRMSARFIYTEPGTESVLVQNNLFVGNGTLLDGTGSLVSNLSTSTPAFVDAGSYDYHLAAVSPARDAGTDPGLGDGVPLTPTKQYLHVSGSEARPSDGSLDVGAYEYPLISIPGASAAGLVDSSLIARDGVNRVYAFAGDVTPDDFDGDGDDPVAVADVTQERGACSFSYAMRQLPDGPYTLAFTSEAADDDPDDDDAIAFTDAALVAVVSGASVRLDIEAPDVIRVGPGLAYELPSQAAAVATDGDVIEIFADEYVGDAVTWLQNDLVLRGIGGRAHLRAAGAYAQEKGTWVIAGDDVVVENVEFSEAAVPDANGAGIRADGANLIVCGSYFHDNENGIKGGVGEMLIEHSEFEHNGLGTPGSTHNVDIHNTVTRLTFRHNYSHRAMIGHNFKSRAAENFILYNRIMDELDGTASFTIDLPDGGLAYVIGNLLQQGPSADNTRLISYGRTGAVDPADKLFVAHNTFVNDRGTGVFLTVRSSTDSALIVNNIFTGDGTVLFGVGDLVTNLVSPDPGLVDRAGFDYRLQAGSAARDAGSDPGFGEGYPLAPDLEYVHTAGQARRWVDATPDIGAYEYVDASQDTDGDGVADIGDNCWEAANSDQRDTDADGFGNLCDPDFNNDGAVNFPDLAAMQAVFFSSDADADLNGDGGVNFADLAIMEAFFFGAPGPSGTVH